MSILLIGARSVRSLADASKAARPYRHLLRGECLQDTGAVLGELVLADAADPAELGRRGRQVGGDLAQRRVVEDDVRRYALLLGDRASPGAQPLEHRRRL